MPDEINDAISTLNERITVSKFSNLQTREKKIRSYLKQYKQLPCYGFNSCKIILFSSNIAHYLLKPNLTCQQLLVLFMQTVKPMIFNFQRSKREPNILLDK